MKKGQALGEIKALDSLPQHNFPSAQCQTTATNQGTDDVAWETMQGQRPDGKGGNLTPRT